MPEMSVTNKPSTAHALKKRINLKAVLVLFVSALVLAGAVHLVYGFQVQSSARAVLEQALQAEHEGDLQQEAEYLVTYLGLDPTDTDALARYGLLLKKLAKTSPARLRAFFVLGNVLNRAPGRQDVRREVVALAMDLRRFTEAKEHLEILLDKRPNDMELVLLFARCERANRQFHKAAQLYDQVTTAEPQRIERFVELASLQRQNLGKPQEADETIQRMVKDNEKSAKARLAAARYFTDAGSFPEAQHELHVLLQELPEKELRELPEKGAEVYLLAADVSQSRGQETEARRYLEEGAKRFADNTRFDRRLARLALRDGRPEAALAYLQRSLKTLPEQPEELWALGNMLIDVGELDQVRRVIDRVPGK